MPFFDELLSHDAIALFTHERPDGDAIGSQIGLGLYLRKLGKRVVLLGDDWPANLKWIGRHGYRSYVGSPEQKEKVAGCGAVVVLDTGEIKRTGDAAEVVEAFEGPRFLIDHHPNPDEPAFHHAYHRESASSTGELVHELITAHDPELIDADIDKALYTAVMTDTGSFRFNSVTPAVHQIAADLLERGDMNPEPIHNAIFNNRSLGAVNLLGRALEGIELFFDGRVAYITVTQRMRDETGTGTQDIRGFVNYALSIQGVQAAVLFVELDGFVKLSFRSEGDLAINGWAQALGGGGHRNAAGAYVQGRLKKIIQRVTIAGGELF
ncbi:MAG: DHH family phosphoesterase [Bacteroidota bacterium]